MNNYLMDIQQIDRSMGAMVGGKGANLGELARIEGVTVPPGFCISTAAYRKVVDNRFERLLDDLHEPGGSQRIRLAIESAPIPEEIVAQIDGKLREFPDHQPFAVRSSATAEDLPTASFAGQQDSFLNVVGKQALLERISQCWASLFTDRAVVYRRQNGFDHRHVALSVVVQAMVFPEVSGVLFTADPLSGHRKVVAIEAGYGLGEALVSGRVSADHYKVRDQEIFAKKLMDRGEKPILTDEQILQLASLGRKIEAHFGNPQDLEWCLSGQQFFFVQSRPITTLYPLPEGKDDGFHVYVSVGHQQMMTDAMKPLGLSVWLATAGRPMDTAGGRLFVDVAADLASPARRNVIVNVLGKSDPLVKDAIFTILERGGIALSSNDQGPPPPNYQAMIEYDPTLIPDLIGRSRAQLADLARELETKSGLDRVDAVIGSFQQFKEVSDPRGFNLIMTAMNAAHWLNDHLYQWLGEKNAADTLSLSVPDNVTSEMGLALLDVADVIRPFPELVNYLQTTGDPHFLEELSTYAGGQAARGALTAYLDKYGMRCTGEIDITRPRWSEQPLTLLPMLLSNIRSFESGEGRRRFEQGRQEALIREQQLLERLRSLPEGEQRVEETRRMVELLRNYAGYREYPKYAIVCRYFLYKQALLKAAECLVKAGVMGQPEDLFYLSLAEFREVMRTQSLDPTLIARRRLEFEQHQKLRPPRVMTSDGEIFNGRFEREGLPAGAIAGLAVSSGVVEGRARVLHSLEQANIQEGDILVTAYTDPSWTPLFVSIRGLVTEVGGLMTHGAVIAREYGLPAVVGVHDATGRIQDGQLIRVNGTDGYVEIIRHD